MLFVLNIFEVFFEYYDFYFLIERKTVVYDIFLNIFSKIICQQIVNWSIPDKTIKY